MSITVSYTIPKSTLVCSMCDQSMGTTIYQCSQNYHFYCKGCVRGNKKYQCIECDSRVFRNKLMEQQIQGQLMSCLYKKCFEKVFTWNYHSHIECCSYKPLKCLFCKEDTCLSYLKNHIRNECTTPYLDYTDSKLKGSDDDLLDRFSHHDTSFKLDMASLSHSFYLIYKRYVVIFIYSTITGWGILIVSLSEGEREVDVFSEHKLFSTLFELKTVADWTTTTNYPLLP
jgi:hypothetical protein